MQSIPDPPLPGRVLRYSHTPVYMTGPCHIGAGPDCLIPHSLLGAPPQRTRTKEKPPMRRTLRARICPSVLISLPAVGLGSGTAGAAPEPTPGVTASATQYAIDSRPRTRTRRRQQRRVVSRRRDGRVGRRRHRYGRGRSGESRRRPPQARRAQHHGTPGRHRHPGTPAKITGTSWGIDPSTNQVAVEADAVGLRALHDPAAERRRRTRRGPYGSRACRASSRRRCRAAMRSTAGGTTARPPSTSPGARPATS